MQTTMREISATMAYLIGAKDYQWKATFEEDLPEKWNELENTECAKIMRSLCHLRTVLFLTFLKTNNSLIYEGKSLRSMEWFDTGAIDYLTEREFPVLFIGKTADDCVVYVNQFINENIENCRSLFPDWVSWDYIKSLFIIPHYQKREVQKAEFSKYVENKNLYPYRCYMYWNKPVDCGNLLYNDEKFLTNLYSWNKDVFRDTTKCKDAGEDIKGNIYDFIDASNKVVIVVDCENSDVYKLYSVLKSLDSEALGKVKKIMLHDDAHTTDGWDYLAKFISIPVEHLEVDRVADRKSLVDISVTTSVCKAHYKDDIDSFILCSSDSDYWGLISSLPEAKFLLMVEHEKTGFGIREALQENNIYYCYLDRFCSGNIEDLKKTVLINELKNNLPNIIGQDARALTYTLFHNARINADGNELSNFYDKYIKSLKLVINEEGVFEIEVKAS